MIAAALTTALSPAAPALAAPLPAGSRITAPEKCAYPPGQTLDGTKTGFTGIESSGMYALVSTPDLPGGHWEIKGQYPKSALASFQTFNGFGITTGFLDGKDIAPDRGSVNPWQPGKRYKPGRNHFTLRLAYTPPSEREHPQPPGVLYTGYREGFGPTTRDPRGGVLLTIQGAPTSFGGVPLPEATWVVDDPSKNVVQNKRQLCAAMYLTAQPFQAVYGASEAWHKPEKEVVTPLLTHALLPMVGDPVSGWNGKPYVTVARPSPNHYSFPFAAESADYIATAPNPLFGKFYVVRFKAPTHSRVAQGIPNTGKEQTGYWAWCGIQTYSYLVNATGCITAEQAHTDRDGYVTLVVSPANERPKIDGRPYPDWLVHPGAGGLVWGVEFGPNPDTYPQSPYFAPPSMTMNPNMPVASDIVYGMHKGTELKQFMGEYYPKVYYCTKQKFEAGQCKSPSK